MKDTLVYTDEHAAYKGIYRPHTAVKHSVKEFVNGLALRWSSQCPLCGGIDKIREVPKRKPVPYHRRVSHEQC